MKIFLSILALLVVSACAGELKPKPLNYTPHQTYVYEYTGTVLTGIPSSSSLYSGTQLKADVQICQLTDQKWGFYVLQLDNVTFSSLIDEVTDPAKAIFNRRETVEKQNLDLLKLKLQYSINNETQHLEYIEVHQDDKPWSLNIKKAIIEMFLVDIAGKQLKLNPDYEHSLTKRSQDEVHHSFDVYEPTSKGSCETMYQVNHALPASVCGLPGLEQFYWKVIKTRNYQNCTTTPRLTQHNWERKGCAEYCKQALILGQTKMNNYYSAEKSQCSCDDIEVEPLDQQSTSTYYIECKEYPAIWSGQSNSKVVFDNHGTRFVSYTNQTLQFNRTVKYQLNRLNSNYAVRVQNLTFSLYPYVGSVAQVLSHEIPIYNLMVPSVSQSALVESTVQLLNQVAVTIMKEDEGKNQRKVADLMQQIVSRLAHLDSKYIMKIYNEKCIVPQDKLYTNTLNSVRRQLFLDAISHVGTRNVSLWLEQVLDLTPESNGLFPIEVRQVVETLPLNVYAPTTSLIELLERKIYSYITEKDWDSLSAFVVAYGKLIAKACPSTEVYPELDNEISSDESRVRSNDWWIPENEKCTLQKTTKYIVALSEKLMEIQSIRGKVLIAQALAHTGKTLALENLEAYVKGEFKCPASEFYGVPDSVSDCTFFRTSVIYALHHMIPVAPKRIRSLVLPIFNDKTESYELRLAAFTVFMSAGPKRHELDSVAVSLQKETSLQVIYMVRSILEETANLTQACHQPLAQAAREIVATLPEVNLDGVYSQASYNEWYSTDKSTGFFANGQFVANNISYIPRHGYLSLGSHWKSLSNSWFTVAFQQKGLETALKNLDAIALSTLMADPKTIDDLYNDLGVESRKEEDFMLKLFVRVHEQTSLFTMDIRTLVNAYHQFKITFRKIVSDASANQVGFNWVRFYMPSTYTDIVPSAIGLPIAALKRNNQIVSLKLTKSDSETDSTFELRSGNINLKVTPQIFTTSHASLSVFNQGIKSESDYGVYTSKKFDLYVPLNLNFAWNFDGKFYDFDYAIKPVFDKTNFHSSNNNFAFIANSNIASAHPIRERKMIQSLVPAYNYPLVQLKSPAIGMNLNLKLSTERPWFVDFTQIPSDGTVAWLLEKYNEMNQFNNNVTLTLVQNEDYPSTGIVGSFSSEQDISGDFAHIMGEAQRDSYTETTKTERIVKELTRLYPSRINDPAFYAQSIDIYFATLGKSEPITFNSTLTLARAIDYHAYWYRLNSTLDNKNTAIWTRVPQRLVIDGKLERPSFPSHLVWELRNPENIVGDYIANISWSSDLSSEQFDTKILVNGQLKRSVPDPVIPEMQRKSWFHRQCEKDIKNGNASNHACERVFDQEAYFNVVTGKIEFMEVEEPVRESIRMVYSELKRSLIYYWRPWSTISYKKVEGEQNVVNFEAAYSNIIYERPVISLTVDTPTEKVNFSKIFVPVAPFPAMHPKEYLKASSLPKDQICNIMKDSVRTFDNITYNTYLEECETVVAMDCAADSQQFAVTVRGKAGERSIRVYTPLKTYFQIWEVKKDSASLTFFDINGNKQADYVLRPGKPGVHLEHLPISRYHEAHQIFIHNGVVNVVLPKENVRIAFDGQYVQITTSPLYVGKTCGLCGNQNQEFTSEFLDPKMVDLESDIEAFRRSYSLRNCTDGGLCPGGNCHLLTSLVHQRRPKFQSTWKSVEKVSKTPIHKTLVIQRENEACFSKYPVKVCRKGEKATKTESQSIDMVCLEKNGHPVHQQWIEEAEKRVIIEVSQLTATETLTYDVPVECVSDKESVRGI